jgi:hypothetical protein
MDHFYAIGEANGIEWTIWDLQDCPDNLDMETSHPCTGATRVVHRDDNGYFGRKGTFAEPIVGSRWIDAWVAIEKVMHKCGDRHHAFISGIGHDGDTIYLSMDS